MPYRRLLLLPMLALLAACAGVGHDRRHARDEVAVSHVKKPGYLPQRQFVASPPIQETWRIGEDEVMEVAALLPEGKGPFPTLLYLPGLGESASDGAAWRRAWAEAGYGVIALQAAKDGKSLWSSAAAREGDFRSIARTHFGLPHLRQRLEQLRIAFTELRTRHDQGVAPYQRLDLSRIGVVGFDLGAQTAMSLAGERAVPPLAAPWVADIKAVIALSPFADFSGPGFEQRFASVRLPVLSVTSPDDDDPYGLVGDAALHRAPFQYMPAGQKYLLSFWYAPHALLGGAEHPPPEPKIASAPRANPENDNRGSGGGRRGGGRRGTRSGGESSGGRESSAREPGLPGRGDESWGDQLLRIRSVTTAFLDQTVKNDPVAGDWLVLDARRWLGESAEFLTK